MNNTDLRQLKILLIDDEPFIRQTLRHILIQIGLPATNLYDADSAGTGQSEAVRVRPMLIFCDIHMPVADGFTFLDNLRKCPIAPVAATPVVMLTSDASEEAVLSAKGHKVAGYLVKPVSINGVKKSIERALKVTLP